MKKKSAFRSVLQGSPAVASPKDQLYEQMTSNPVFTDRNIQRVNAYLLCSRQEQKSLVTHHTLQSSVVRMCLACQHFDFNSADWISDNLHVISGRYLRTMGKEFIFQFLAEVRGAGMRDEPLRRSAWEAIEVTFSSQTSSKSGQCKLVNLGI